MSEQSPESTPTPDVTVEADQAVVNTAPDGGGVDNNEAAPEAPSETESDTAAGEERSTDGADTE